MKKITEADVTPEQWKQIDALYDHWSADQTIQIPDAEVRSTLLAMWKLAELPDPTAVLIADSPLEALRLAAALTMPGELFSSSWHATGGDLDKLTALARSKASAIAPGKLRARMREITSDGGAYMSIWWQTWAARGQAGQILGIDDADFVSQTKQMTDWSRSCPYVVSPVVGLVVVSRRPVEVHWDGETQNRLDGPVVRYADGFALYAIEDVVVPEQVVMAPHTLTVEQINAEPNDEVRRIMRQQFGEDRYILESGAELIQFDTEQVGTGSRPRILVQQKDGSRWLVGADGSTGRIYSMSVPATAATCQQAHEAISGLAEARCKGKS